MDSTVNAADHAAEGGAMHGHSAQHIDGMQSIHGGLVKLAGAELGVESFGIQLLDLPAGFTDYPEHDHAADGQEEVYVVMAGEVEFEVDRERLSAPPGMMLRVGPAARRKIWSGPSGARVLAIGCAAGSRYERPEDFRLTVRA